jgi:TfoX/Sxy family transcriptional regulator of competence genes
VPTYTLAGLGGISATFLSGTSGISYNSTTGVISYSGTVYTDASIRALLSGSTGISYNSTTGAISYSGTVYTDASVRALISITTTGTSGASTYNNTTGVINVPNYTLAGLGGISLTSLSGGTGITYNNTTGAISYSGTVYTDASVRALISATGNISYNSTTGVISTSLTQYTDALARASISLTTTGTSGVATYNSTTGVFNIPNYGSALSGYLPLTGGTLTGALGGTSATFSSSVTVNGTLIAGASNGNIRIKGSTDGFLGAGDTDGKLYLTDWATGAKGLSILLSTGAATFSSSIGIGSSPKTFTGTSAAALQLGTSYVGTFAASSTFGTILGNNVYYNTDWKRTLAQGVSFIQFSEDNFYFANGATGAADGTFSPVTRMAITSAGNVGIGTTSPDAKLQLSGSTSTYFKITRTSSSVEGAIVLEDTANSTSWFLYRPANTTQLRFYNGNGDQAAFTYGGNLLLGTTSDNGERLYISGNVRATGTITANSDITLKKNLLKIENALEKVEQINGYTYEFKADDSKRHAGVIAQEIQTVLPEIVNKGNDGILGVEYGNISALLIEAIKEQQTQINELKALLNK